MQESPFTVAKLKKKLYGKSCIKGPKIIIRSFLIIKTWKNVLKKKFPWVCPVSVLQNIFIATIKQQN